MSWKNTKHWRPSTHGSTGAGHGGPARGAGWGGPARPQRQFQGSEGGRALVAHRTDPGSRAKRLRRAAEMEDVLYDVASNPEVPEMARITAADKLLNRIEGLPVARNLNINGSAEDLARLTDADLARIVAEGGPALDGAEVGAGETLEVPVPNIRGSGSQH